MFQTLTTLKPTRVIKKEETETLLFIERLVLQKTIVLNDWESKFVNDMMTRYHAQGYMLHVSDKQINVLMSLVAKL